MIRYLILILFLLPLKFSNAQEVKDSTVDDETVHNYYERLHFTESRYPDSAMYYARLLERQSLFSQAVLKDHIQGIFAEQFKKATQGGDSAQTMIRVFLNKMLHDTSSLLSSLAQPMSLWVEALDNQEQPARMAEIVNKFLQQELNKKDLYSYYNCRYALLTWQLLIRNNILDSLSAELFNKIVVRLTPYLSQNLTSLQATEEVRKICILRYLFASAQYLKAQSLLQRNEKEKAIAHFRMAFRYSPDNTGISLAGVFAYDMLLLFGTMKISFREDYVDFLLANKGSKKEILSCLSTMTMSDPSSMQRLKEYYKTLPGKPSDFDQYWIQFLNGHLERARGFSIKMINGSVFSTRQYKNKWIIAYFWGTWCGPCRRDLPQVDSFYRNNILANAGPFELVTIACHDQEENVKVFMKKNKYSFPVAMADDKVQQLFPIAGYPTKILITPGGRYQVIPFGQPWQDFIKNYTDPIAH